MISSGMSWLYRAAQCIGGVGLVCLLTCASGSVNAQGWPVRPVTLSVGQNAGGAADIIARALAEGLGKVWGQAVVVENKPGAGGSLATHDASRARPDGYTLTLANEGSITRAPFLQASLGYDPVKDLTPIAMAGLVPMVLVVNPQMMPLTDLKAFVAQAKGEPGRINYASSGTGASHHIAMAMFEEAAGIRLNQVPYKGGAPALQDLVAGQVPVMFVGVSTALPFIKAGKLKPLAVGSSQRSLSLPDVPTMQEQGYPGFEIGDWLAVFAPHGTPADIARKIAADVITATQSPAYQSKLLAAGLELKPVAGKDLEQLIDRTMAKNKEIFRSAGIVPSN